MLAKGCQKRLTSPVVAIFEPYGEARLGVHGRGGGSFDVAYSAMATIASISIRTPLGRALTPTAARAGGSVLKNSA